MKSFNDKDDNGESEQDRNYIVRAYVFSQYLDRHVSLERGGFEFSMDGDLFFGISQAQIEKKAAGIAQAAIGSEIRFRQEKKREHVTAYVDAEAPWHKELLNSVDLGGLSYKPTNEEIEVVFQKEKFSRERAIKRDVNQLLDEANIDDVQRDGVRYREQNLW